MIKRSLQEMYSEISYHEEAIKKIKQEVKDFQAACSHPEKFQKVEHKSTTDEYGRTDGHYKIVTCLMCLHTEHREEN